MAKIPLTGRRVIPTGRIGEVETPPGFGQATARAQERLGATLQQLGGQFAQLGKKIRDTQEHNELVQAQIDYERDIDQHLIDQERNPNISDWTSNTTKRHDEIVSQISLRKMLPKAREQFGLWAQAQENKVHFKVATRSNSIIAQNERNGLQREMESTANHGRRDDFEVSLDGMVERNNLLPSEREEWLAKYDDKVVTNHAFTLIEGAMAIQEPQLQKEAFKDAEIFIDSLDDAKLRTQLNASLRGAKAAAQREKATDLRLLKEQTHATLLADYWDGALTNPQIVTDALRQGLLTPEAAKALNKALTDSSSRTTSDLNAVREIEETLLKMREGLVSKEEAYSALMIRSGLLTNTDGKSYIKEISSTQEDVNSRWDREGWDYIEAQILNVASLTGIRFGSGEQIALSAQAHIKYSEAKRQAAADGKPLQGEELLALAHKIMLPYRQQIKPLIPGREELPDLTVTPVRRPSIFRSLPPRIGPFRRVSDRAARLPATANKPKSVEEFNATFKRISTVEGRRAYYNRFAAEVFK